MKPRRSTASSALAFMDCICCAFGAVLLLFILTANTNRQQKVKLQEISESSIAELQESLNKTQHKLNQIDQTLKKQFDNTVQLEALRQAHSKKSQVEKAIQITKSQLETFKKQQTHQTKNSRRTWKKAPSDPRYLSDLHLKGPNIAIILESSGSMLGEDVASARRQLAKSPSKSHKWQRAKSILHALIANIPERQKFALLSMQAETVVLTKQASSSYIDSEDGEAIAKTLKIVEKIEPKNGANLAAAMRALQELSPPPSSILLITDGLPTAPAQARSRLSESDRVKLFFEAVRLCPDLAFNVILLPLLEILALLDFTGHCVVKKEVSV